MGNFLCVLYKGHITFLVGYRWKIGLINCMLYRAYNICCNWYSFTKEIEVLRDLFRQNGYPGLTFENCVKRFIDSKFIPCKKQTQQEGISQFITIPYFGHPSIAFARKLRQSFKTKRHLATRIKEHRSEKSAIGQHLQTCHTCDHNFNENQFKILSTGNSDFDCKIREALLIKSQKPTLNQQLFQNGSTFILCVFK